MKHIALTALTLIALTGFAHAGDSIRPEPGMWEQTTLLSPDGSNWKKMSHTQGCMTKEQATDWESKARQQITAAQCTVQSLSVSMGKISGTITCANMNHTQMKMEGSYDGRSYDIDLVSTGTVMLPPAAGGKAVPVKLYGKWTGRMVRACS